MLIIFMLIFPEINCFVELGRNTIVAIILAKHVKNAIIT